MAFSKDNFKCALSEAFNIPINKIKDSMETKYFIIRKLNIYNSELQSTLDVLSGDLKTNSEIFQNLILTIKVPTIRCDLKYFIENLREYHKQDYNRPKIFEDIKNIFWTLRDKNIVTKDVINCIKKIEKKTNNKKLKIGICFLSYKKLLRINFNALEGLKEKIIKSTSNIQGNDIEANKLRHFLQNFLNFKEIIVIENVSEIRYSYIYYDLACLAEEQNVLDDIDKIVEIYIENGFGCSSDEKQNIIDDIKMFLSLIYIKKGLIRLIKNKSNGDSLIKKGMKMLEK